jgi:hypothetical protein
MVAQSLFQIDWWSFTNVDMYSSYTHDDIVYSFPRSYYKDVVGAQVIANSWWHRQRAKGELIYKVRIQLRKGGFDQKNGRKKIGPFGVSRVKQWRKSVFSRVLVEDFRAKPQWGAIE